MIEKRIQRLQDAVEAERKEEEAYFSRLAGMKTHKERIDSGVMWYPVEILKQNYSTGEHIEMELSPGTPAAHSGSHAFRVGASARFFLNDEHKTEWKGTISWTKRRKLRIIINSDMNKRSDQIKYHKAGVELIFDDRPYRVMLNSLSQISKIKQGPVKEIWRAISNQNLSQASSDAFGHLTLPNLNSSQNAAVQMALSSELMSIIHGPPGTGKTTTLVELVSQLVKVEKKVLVCAPSNSAVDLLCKRISQRGESVLRIGNVTRIGDNISHLTLSERMRMHKDWSHIKKVKIEAEESRKEASKFKRKFGQKERMNRGLMYKEARELQNWARELEDRLSEQIISESSVVCTTLIGAAHKMLAGLKFKTVVVDEASQALEPEMWTVMLKAERVVMAGDHMQLPPTVKSRDAKQLGLEETVLDRMTGEIYATALLQIQYRMHPAILSFSNSSFYGGSLRSADVIAMRGSPFENPLHFIDTSGCGFEEELNPESLSRKNPGEFMILREYIHGQKELLQNLEIGIISPYREQVRRIREDIDDDSLLQTLDIEVNSIDGFQGEEKDVIFISFVRSNDRGEIGFLADERRLNVAMTRAKYLLVMVGDMSTLCISPLFEKLADHVEKEGKYSSAWEYMS